MGELCEKHLVQLFDRYATYNGSNPYQTPATLSVISHLEHNLGAFLPEGGMHRITQSLVDQALRLGVKFHFSEPVLQLYSEKGKVTGVRTSKGYSSANIVVSDVDILGFYTSIFPDVKRVSKIKKEERSSSALIFYWGMKVVHPKLDVHNIFFSSNYKEEFNHLFGLNAIYNDPTVYVYVSSKYNPTDAPTGCENWFVMVNAPADIGQDWGKMIELARQNILNKLGEMLGKDLSAQICCEEILSPPEIFRLTGSINGSLYGNSSNNRYASFKRQANYCKDIKGLYFVGGTVHPGGGIPLCLSSAKIVEGLVKEDLESILTSK
jgi:phytoene desaturase